MTLVQRKGDLLKDKIYLYSVEIDSKYLYGYERTEYYGTSSVTFFPIRKDKKTEFILYSVKNIDENCVYYIDEYNNELVYPVKTYYVGIFPPFYIFSASNEGLCVEISDEETYTYFFPVLFAETISNDFLLMNIDQFLN